jgi:serine/threonine-protein kinase RsbW
MTGNGRDLSQEKFDLRGGLSEIERLHAWIAGLASRHGIPGNLQFAMNLCLEEALSNIIQHGYGGQRDGSVTVRFTTPRAGYFVYVVDDEAPYFNPLDAPELPALSPHAEFRIGGQGLRLLRGFADTLEYEPTPTGNRLRIGFSGTGSAVGPR